MNIDNFTDEGTSRTYHFTISSKIIEERSEEIVKEARNAEPEEQEEGVYATVHIANRSKVVETLINETANSIIRENKLVLTGSLEVLDVVGIDDDDSDVKVSLKIPTLQDIDTDKIEILTVKYPSISTYKSLVDEKIAKLAEEHDMDVDDDLAIEIGEQMGMDFSDLEEMEESLEEFFEEQYSKKIERLAKIRVLDEIYDKYKDFPVPDSLLEGEIQRLLEIKSEEPDEEDEGKSDDEIKEECREKAKRTMLLDKILRKLATKLDIECTEEDLEEAIINEARRYPGQEQEVYNHYLENDSERKNMSFIVLHDKVVTHFLEEADNIDDDLSVEEFNKQLKRPEYDWFG